MLGTRAHEKGIKKRFEMDLLHVVLELLDSAFVQIATEQCEQIGG